MSKERKKIIVKKENYSVNVFCMQIEPFLELKLYMKKKNLCYFMNCSAFRDPTACS